MWENVKWCINELKIAVLPVHCWVRAECRDKEGNWVGWKIHEYRLCCSVVETKVNMKKRKALLGESWSEVCASRFRLSKCEKTSTEGLET